MNLWNESWLLEPNKMNFLLITKLKFINMSMYAAVIFWKKTVKKCLHPVYHKLLHVIFGWKACFYLVCMFFKLQWYFLLLNFQASAQMSLSRNRKIPLTRSQLLQKLMAMGFQVS
jgi:hypothetical protein